VNTLRLSRAIRRIMLPLAVLLGFLLWWNYGTLTVPDGMDTLPDEYPPGCLCVIDMRPGAPRAGQVVFVAFRGGLLLTRIARVEGEVLFADHDDAARYPDGDELGPLPVTAVRAVVLTAFVPDPAPAEVPPGGR
jgi:hypothetical protein